MVAGLAQQHVIDVACGNHHTLALTNNENLWLCGSNEFGQLSI
jgi:alpha-tubulin suppressor-like RCC1 family protein